MQYRQSRIAVGSTSISAEMANENGSGATMRGTVTAETGCDSVSMVELSLGS